MNAILQCELNQSMYLRVKVTGGVSVHGADGMRVHQAHDDPSECLNNLPDVFAG